MCLVSFVTVLGHRVPEYLVSVILGVSLRVFWVRLTFKLVD